MGPQAFAGQAPGYSMLVAFTTQASSNAPAFAASVANGYAKISDASLALMVLNTLGVTANSVTVSWTWIPSRPSCCR